VTGCTQFKLYSSAICKTVNITNSKCCYSNR